MKTFGVGRNLSVAEWNAYLLQMLQMGLFEVDYSENNHLKITEYGNEVLFGRQSIELNRFKRRAFKQEETTPVITEATHAPKHMDKVLFEKLRDLRKAIAQASKIAPYMVFSDKSLTAMATEKPTTQAEFGLIHGVGEVKCQKYWRAFTAAIKEPLAQ